MKNAKIELRHSSRKGVIYNLIYFAVEDGRYFFVEFWSIKADGSALIFLKRFKVEDR